MDPEDIPDKIPEMKPIVLRSQLQEILDKVLGDLQEKALAEMDIPQTMVKEIQAGGKISVIAKQFCCVICDNFIVPNFKIGLEGIDVSTL